MGLGVSEVIILITLFIIYGIFLGFDLFKREEKYAYLSYIVAVIPSNYLWYLSLEMDNFDVLGAYVVLFVLWIISLLRDTFGVYLKQNKEINEIILYLSLGILIQLIISAILPEINADLELGTEKLLFFWLPNVHSEVFSSSIATTFKIAATMLVLLIIIPLIIDIKDEEIPFPVFIIIIAIFIAPFLYLSYIWVPEAMAVLTFLMSVILLIVLLLITKSGKETK
ncbi:MAG: hypothetical protein ACFFHD_11235 [Promethearchaeota archaeon]